MVTRGGGARRAFCARLDATAEAPDWLLPAWSPAFPAALAAEVPCGLQRRAVYGRAGPSALLLLPRGAVSSGQGQREEGEGLWPRSCGVVSNGAVALLCRGVSGFADLLCSVTVAPVLSPVSGVRRPRVSDLWLTGDRVSERSWQTL